MLALHFAGEYLKANYAVPMYELARDARVTAKKLNFDGTLTPTTDWEPSWLSTEETEATGYARPVPARTVGSPAVARSRCGRARLGRADASGASVSAASGILPPGPSQSIVTISIGAAQQGGARPAGPRQPPLRPRPSGRRGRRRRSGLQHATRLRSPNSWTASRFRFRNSRQSL